MTGDPGLALRRLRETQGLSLRDLGAKTGLSISLISRAETGHLDDTNFGAVVALVRALGTTINELYTMEIIECPTCEGRGWMKK